MCERVGDVDTEFTFPGQFITLTQIAEAPPLKERSVFLRYP